MSGSTASAQDNTGAEMPCFDHQAGRYLPTGDANIYFETAGNPAGHPLVLLHGGLGSLADFNAILPRLPDNMHCIGIDLRGHGKSTHGSSNLSYAHYQADVKAVLDHLHIRTCSLLGLSDGGIVGYRIAAKHPEMIERLITVGAQWRLTEADPAYSILGGLTSQMWTEMFPDSAGYYESINPQPDFDGLVQAAVGAWTDLTASGYPGESVSAIRRPLLIIRGDGDFLFSLSEAGELQKQVSGSALLNIPFASHSVYDESPEIFMLAVNEFLARTPESSR